MKRETGLRRRDAVRGLYRREHGPMVVAEFSVKAEFNVHEVVVVLFPVPVEDFPRDLIRIEVRQELRPDQIAEHFGVDDRCNRHPGSVEYRDLRHRGLTLDFDRDLFGWIERDMDAAKEEIHLLSRLELMKFPVRVGVTCFEQSPEPHHREIPDTSDSCLHTACFHWPKFQAT